MQQHVTDNLVAEEGTFQVIRHDKVQEVFTTDFLVEIESRRHTNEDIYWQYSEHSTIYIPSAATINSPAFKKLSLYISDEK